MPRTCIGTCNLQCVKGTYANGKSHQTTACLVCSALRSSSEGGQQTPQSRTHRQISSRPQAGPP